MSRPREYPCVEHATCLSLDPDNYKHLTVPVFFMVKVSHVFVRNNTVGFWRVRSRSAKFHSNGIIVDTETCWPSKFLLGKEQQYEIVYEEPLTLVASITFEFSDTLCQRDLDNLRITFAYLTDEPKARNPYYEQFISKKKVDAPPVPTSSGSDEPTAELTTDPELCTVCGKERVSRFVPGLCSVCRMLPSSV